MNSFKPIPTIAINLKKRTDRKAHIIKEFEGRPEFRLTIVDAIEDTIGARGLWQTLQYIIRTYTAEEEYIIICEDDHQFTQHYSIQLLTAAVHDAVSNHADVLCGGASWFNSAIPLSQHAYWTEKYTGLQFTIIFKKFYENILHTPFNDNDAADLKISSLADKKLFIYPFISIQKEFGYSDVTAKNNAAGRVDELFKTSEANVTTLKNIARYYSARQKTLTQDEISLQDICITTYIVKTTNGDIEQYIDRHFSDKPELVPIVVHSDDKHPSHLLSSARVLKNIMTAAAATEDDVIIICDEYHQFSPAYSSGYLIRNILEAYQQGADILFGGGNDFGLVVPVSEHRFWVGSVNHPQFTIIFKAAFSKILVYLDDVTSPENDILSAFSSNKMVLCPFVSTTSPTTEKRLLTIREYAGYAENSH
ncbi:hypothetical protein FHW36_104335 [Chitinophaga polysaccharea]|uniref:Glycosyl transferase family 25 n=1 Tax=Chitinophaga polysaccharea TaxID=1293035 RepID=A0A561PRA4_9BACT|nr:hypothetical protein [Chitinophaga polysaccharea]TWF40652.1 hypothetical protein FHW36_104335 [Chitinophaga polysaccharea]